MHKKNIVITILITAISATVLLLSNMTDQLFINANEKYQVYLHGEMIGMIDNEEVISLATICENCTDKETSLRSAIQELIDNGYLERNMVREKGKIKGVNYNIVK